MKKVSRYDQIQISEDTAKGMNLNINDLTFIKRVFDLQDAANEEQNEKIVKEVVEIITPIFKRLENLDNSILSIKGSIGEIVLSIGAINKRLDKMAEITDDHTKIINRLVRTQKWWNVAGRILIAVAISAIISLLIHYNLSHNSCNHYPEPVKIESVK